MEKVERPSSGAYYKRVTFIYPDADGAPFPVLAGEVEQGVIAGGHLTERVGESGMASRRGCADALVVCGGSGRDVTVLLDAASSMKDGSSLKEVFLVLPFTEDSPEGAEALRAVRLWTEDASDCRFAGAFCAAAGGDGLFDTDALNDAFLFGKEI